jgi:hypothetical protein
MQPGVQQQTTTLQRPFAIQKNGLFPEWNNPFVFSRLVQAAPASYNDVICLKNHSEHAEPNTGSIHEHV